MDWINPARSSPLSVSSGVTWTGFAFHASISERSCAGQLGNARAHAGSRAQRRAVRSRARWPLTANRSQKGTSSSVAPSRVDRPHRAWVSGQVDLRERGAVGDAVEVERAVAERGADRLEVVRRGGGPVLGRIAVQRREAGLDHDRRRPGSPPAAGRRADASRRCRAGRRAGCRAARARRSRSSSRLPSARSRRRPARRRGT